MKKPAGWAGFFDLYFYFTGLREIVGQRSSSAQLFSGQPISSGVQRMTEIDLHRSQLGTDIGK
jgi:hypothetical protein